MTVTVTRAAERDQREDVRAGRRLGRGQLLLALTSIVALLAIALAYAGRTRVAGLSAPAAQTGANLQTVTDARALEPGLEGAFASVADRRFAASSLLAHVQSMRDAGDRLPNVGAVLGATVPVSAVERVSLPEYGDRLRRAVERAEARGVAPPARLPLFTADNLAAMKPAFVVRTSGEFRALVLRWAAVYFIAIWGVALVWWLRGSPGDYALLAAAHLLTGIGFAVILSRPDPLRDTALFVRYTQGVAAGCVGLAVCSLLSFRRTALAAFTYVPLAGALLLSVLLLLFGSGPAESNARVNLGPIQPVEGIRLLLGLFLAAYFARRWELLRQIRERTFRKLRVPDWLHLPRAEYVLPVAIGIAAALLFFFLQKDLGPALFMSCIFLAAYAVARNRAGLALCGLGVLVGGFYIGYVLNISTTLSARVYMWRSAWDNVARGGDQIAQAIWALSTGGLFGTGLGLGDTRYVPAGYTDLPLAAIGEELGFAGLLCVFGAFVLVGARGFSTALRAANDYALFLATIVTLFLVLPVVVMSAGMLGVLPLTGVVTPFISYGGSAMAANFAALGILIAIRNSATTSTSAALPFRTGIVWLRTSLGVVAVALVAVLLNIQVVNADAYVVKPHLGLQGDGVRRYQYNQRVLDVAAFVPRGTVYDRNGLPLATSSATVAQRAAADYKSHGLAQAACAPAGDERCYPLGGGAFHLLGDASTRINWTASNSSYVERDLQDRLRGFDDHAVPVRVATASGGEVLAIRRDYSDLIPLLRHRHQPGHAGVKAFLARRRDVALTIDAPFQSRIVRILEKYASRSATGRAAAVVIDPDTGALLASASYPYPGVAGDEDDDEDDSGGVLLDRARFGLYPPGSTFKLVTAAAALRLDSGSARTTFMCTHQTGSRVGAHIPGYGLVRDDRLDTHPHGSLAMRDGIVRSCNAYFAQLAVRMGARGLLDTATLVGVSVARDGSMARLRSTLPQAGYGQGDVVATPLRMARVAAAIANGGTLREPHLEGAKADGSPQRLLTPAAATFLAGSLREAVLTGTARTLAGHPSRIAGKTGTAEVSGQPSHAWFVGFAPHGAAEKKIAFAVLIEQAGYGAVAAAPAAGEIVTAAAERGLVR